MKVTKIQTFVCDAYRTNWVFLKVHTDEGLYGVGEARLETCERAVEAALKELERYIVGRDAHDIEAFWHDAYRDAYWRGGPVLMSALAGVEMAPFGSAYMDVDKKTFHSAIDTAAAVHDVVGDRVDLLIEGHGQFNEPTAIRIGRALEAFDVLWLEEPIPSGNLKGLADIRRRVRVPIAAGERLYSRGNFRECFRMECVD